MAGVEVAGLVLAVIPLFIAAAEHYDDSLSPIRRVFQTPLEIRKYYLALNDQKTYVRLSLIALFGKLPSLSQSQKQALMNDDSDLSSLWNDENLQEEIQDVLGHAYGSYIANLDAIVSALERLVIKDKSLRLGPTVGQGYLRALYDESFHMEWTKKDWERRIRFSRHEKKRSQVLAEIEGCNQKLREFWRSCQETTPIVDSWQRRPGDPLIHVNEDAQCLHNVLQRCWQCQCCIAHDTLLQLEQRQVPKRRARTNIHFNLLFASKTSSGNTDECSWQQMEVRVLAKSERVSQPTRMPAVRWADPEPAVANISSPVQKNPRSHSLANISTTTYENINYAELEDVTTICNITIHPQPSQSCFGFVIDGERNLKGPYLARLWHKPFSPKVLSLDVLLQTTAAAQQPVDPTDCIDNMSLFKLERLTLAVNLASSLLQLHTTPWVNERWNKRDILFLASNTRIYSGSQPRPIDIERPLLAQRFHSNGPAASSINPFNLPRPTHPNLSVLSLGIMLLELWFATPIESRRLPSDLVDGQPNSSTDLAVAERWVKENVNLENMPAGYWQAVSSCIYCFFQPMPRDKSLENPDFREAVWQNIVVPLDRELQTWKGL